MPRNASSRLLRRPRLAGSRRRSGIEVVEMAMVLPILVMITLGILEFGRAFEVTQWLTAASREGARLGMLYNVVKESDRQQGITSANQKVELDIKNFLAASGLDPTKLRVLIVEHDTNDPARAVNLDDYATISEQYFKVRVEIDAEDALFFSPFFLRNGVLSGEIVVRHE